MTYPDLKNGVHTAEVGNWQRYLNQEECTDANARKLIVDEVFGPKTAYATKQWQERNGVAFNLVPTGALDKETRRAVKERSNLLNVVGFIPFIQAAKCQILYPNARDNIDVITIHTMESGEKPGTAEAVARWFAGPSSPVASAHYCVDPDNVIQCVRDTDVAYHAPGCNNNGLGIEHAGRARQTALDWADDDSLAILLRSAKLCAALCKKYEIPIVRLKPDDLKKHARGFCGHADVTHAFPGPKRDHLDPGEAFPWEWFLKLTEEMGI